jgi:Holliday junction resolvasome RuvABC ATP-dependent DNA helicase subunit
VPTILNHEALERELSLSELILPPKISRVIEFELVQSARQSRPPRHMLALAGSGGTGKTSIGLAMAKELGYQVMLVSAPPVRAEVDGLKNALEDGMVLLLDEIHSYSRQPWLLDLLEGARGLGRQVEFCAFGATTNRGQLPQTIMSRFPIRLDIDYTDEQLLQIADQIASRSKIVLSDEERVILLRASVGNPRTMRNILGFWEAGPAEAVSMAQLTRDGLDSGALAMLAYLHEHDRPIGRDTLSRILEAPGGIQDVESVLTRRRYITPTPSGLTITAAGKKRLRVREEKGI